MITDLRTGRSFSPTLFSLKKNDLIRLGAFSKQLWGEDWENVYLTDDVMVYGLFENMNASRLEGLVAFEEVLGSMEMVLLETARHNRYTFPQRVYSGVGRYLVAYGCFLSMKKNHFPRTRGNVSAVGGDRASRKFYESIGAIEISHNYWNIDCELSEEMVKEQFGGRGKICHKL